MRARTDAWSPQRAVKEVGIAIGHHVLRRPAACEICGARSNLHYHHWSYRPIHALDVIPLCRSCHTRVHAGAVKEPRTGRTLKRGQLFAEFSDMQADRMSWQDVDAEISAAYRRILGDPPPPVTETRRYSYFELWLRDKMRRAKLTDVALAGVVGVPVGVIQDWVDGRSIPPDDVRQRLYDPLRVTAPDFSYAVSRSGL